MPRSTSANYKTAATPYTTIPRAFIRPSFVRKAGDGVDYPFSADLASHDVVASTKTKVKVLHSLRGSTQRVDLLQRRAEIGVWTIPLVDRDGEISKYIADPGLPLRVAISQ